MLGHDSYLRSARRPAGPRSTYRTNKTSRPSPPSGKGRRAGQAKILVWPWRLLTGRFEAVELPGGSDFRGETWGMGSRRPLLLGGGPPQRQPAVPGSNTTIRCFRLLERRRRLLRYMLFLVVRLISVVSLEFPIPVAPFRPSATRPPARPGQPRRPTRRPAPGACGSAPAPARGARAGQACSGQGRPSWEPGYPSTRDRSTSQLPA
jgi:hypothetical protein